MIVSPLPPSWLSVQSDMRCLLVCTMALERWAPIDTQEYRWLLA